MKHAIVTFVLLLMASMPAWADIDQRCVSLCTTAGKPPSGCLAQCTYNRNPAKAEKSDTQDLKNKVFTPLAPAGEEIVPSIGAKPNNPNKDVACETRCQRNGLQTQLCDEACTKPICAPGKVMCTDELGNKTLPGHPQMRPLDFLPDPEAAPAPAAH